MAAGDSDARIAALNAAVAAADPALAAYRAGAAGRRGEGRRRARLHRARWQGAGRRQRCRRRRCPKAPRTCSTTTACGANSAPRWPRCSCCRPTATSVPSGIAELRSQADESKLPLIDKAAAVETDAALKEQLELLRAAVGISSARQVAPPAGRHAAGRQPAARHARAAAGAPGRGDRRRGQGGDQGLAGAGRTPPAVGRMAGCVLHRRQPGFDPDAGGAGPGHHLRPDGRHQHGARRADDDRRLCHLRGAEPVPANTCRAPSTSTCWRRSRSASGPRRRWVRCWSAASSAGSTAGRWRRCSPPGASASSSCNWCARSSVRRTSASRTRPGCRAVCRCCPT